MPDTKKKINKLENRAECINKVHTYINDTMPELIKAFAQGYKLNNDNRLHKKDKERINAILDKRTHFRAFLETSQYSIVLNADDHYQVAQFGCNYYKQYVYVWDHQAGKPYDFKPLPMTSTKELEQAQKELAKLEDQKYEIRKKISKLERLLN